MKTIAVCNQQQGVGKTTLSFHLAVGLYELGFRVLLIDLDPQGLLSILFEKGDTCNISGIFSKSPTLTTDLLRYQSVRNRMDLISSNLHLAKAEIELQSHHRQKLREALFESSLDWEYVVVDCPSSLGLFTQIALTASDFVLIPCLPSYRSPLVLKDLLAFTDGFVRTGLNEELKVAGILINQADMGEESLESIGVLEENFSELVFKPKIPKSSSLKELLFSKQAVWKSSPSSTAGITLKKFIGEFVDRVGESSIIEFVKK